MSTETAAAAAVSTILSRCPHLESVLATHDRVPLTDGHIDVYSSSSRAKKDWRGRVNVQVKGRVGKKPAPSFSLGRTELQAHMSNNGLLLLCVDFNATGGKATPRYAALTPYGIRDILESIPEDQKSVAIALTKLPRLPEALDRIAEVVLVGSRQNPFARTDPRLFESVTHMAISTVEELDLSAPRRLRQGETVFAVEAMTEDGSQVPLDGDFEIVPPDYVERVREVRVTAGDAVFESFTVQRITPEEMLVTLDEGLTMTIHEGAGRRTSSINATNQGDFTARKRALEFVVGVADGGQITFGDHVFSLGQFPVENASVLEGMREHLAFLREIQDLLDRLEIDGSLIDFASLTDQDIEHLRVLYNVLIQGAAPSNADGKPGRAPERSVEGAVTWANVGLCSAWCV